MLRKKEDDSPNDEQNDVGIALIFCLFVVILAASVAIAALALGAWSISVLVGIALLAMYISSIFAFLGHLLCDQEMRDWFLAEIEGDGGIGSVLSIAPLISVASVVGFIRRTFLY